MAHQAGTTRSNCAVIADILASAHGIATRPDMLCFYNTHIPWSVATTLYIIKCLPVAHQSHLCILQLAPLEVQPFVQDSGTAKALAFHKEVRTRCVTLDGDDFNPGGLLTGQAPMQTHHCRLLCIAHATMFCTSRSYEMQVGLLNTLTFAVLCLPGGLQTILL